MGGFIAAELAINFPQRVERLMLVSAAGLSTYNDPAAIRCAAAAAPRSSASSPPTPAGSPPTPTPSPAAPGCATRPSASSTSHPSRLPAALAAEQVRGAGKPGFIQALQANLDYDFRDRLGEIACPTLIVWGDRDRVITARDAERFAELIPGSRKVVFEDTGHVPMLERPAEFNALLAEFLAE